MPKEIFISYSRKDTATADRICQALDQAGITYFIDRQGISGGAGFTNVLAEEITKSQIILFIASQNAYQSAFTNKEITFAVNHHKHILPYIIDGSPPPPRTSTFSSPTSTGAPSNPTPSKPPSSPTSSPSSTAPPLPSPQIHPSIP